MWSQLQWCLTNQDPWNFIFQPSYGRELVRSSSSQQPHPIMGLMWWWWWRWWFILQNNFRLVIYIYNFGLFKRTVAEVGKFHNRKTVLRKSSKMGKSLSRWKSIFYIVAFKRVPAPANYNGNRYTTIVAIRQATSKFTFMLRKGK